MIRWLVIVVTSMVALVGVALLTLRSCVGIAADRATRPVTDVQQYSAILATWPPALVGHFPASLPANATNVQMHYQPAFLQGAASLELKVTVPTREAARIAAAGQRTAAALAKQIAVAFHPCLELLPCVPDSLDLPPGWQAFVLVNPAGIDYGGVAVNATSGEVVYFAFDD